MVRLRSISICCLNQEVLALWITPPDTGGVQWQGDAQLYREMQSLGGCGQDGKGIWHLLMKDALCRRLHRSHRNALWSKAQGSGHWSPGSGDPHTPLGLDVGFPILGFLTTLSGRADDRQDGSLGDSPLLLKDPGI